MSIPLVILIASHGRPVLLGRALRSVAACDRPPGYAGCVVVENGPAAGAEAVVAEVAAEDPGAGLRYMHVARANKSAALNAALADVPAETLCVFFDDDVDVSPQTLQAFVDAAAVARPSRAFFGGVFDVRYEAEPPPLWLHPLLPRSAKGVARGSEMGDFLGFNWAAFACDLRATGGFDPEVGPGAPSGATGQEAVMQRRLRANGLVGIRVDDAHVTHFVPPERATAAWACRRRFRRGLSDSVSRREDIVLGPASITREVAASVLSLARAVVNGSRERAWAAYWRLSYIIGYVYGTIRRTST